MKKIYAMIAVILLTSFTGNAQNKVVIADEAGASNYIPLYTQFLHYRQHNQIIYPAELIPEELKGAHITKITFQTTKFSGASDIPEWGGSAGSLKLMNTTTKDLTNGLLGTANATTLDSGRFRLERNTTVYGAFDWVFQAKKSFVYTGGNLLFDLYVTNAPATTPSGQFAIFQGMSMPNNCAYISYLAGGSAAWAEKFLPKVTIEYCKVVTQSFSDMTAYSVTLNGQGIGVTGNFGFTYQVNNGARQQIAATTEPKTGYTAMRCNINAGLNVGAKVTYYAWCARSPGDTVKGSTLEFTMSSGCFKPVISEITNVTETGATIVWKTGSSAQNYNLRYKTRATDEWTYKRNVSLYGGALTNLSAGTTYDVQVQALCSTGDTSTWSDLKSFRTSCGLLPVPYYQDFSYDFGYNLTALCYSTESEFGRQSVDPVDKNIKIDNGRPDARLTTFYLLLPKFEKDVNLLTVRFTAHYESSPSPGGFENRLYLGVVRDETYIESTFSAVSTDLDFTSTPERYTFDMKRYNFQLTGNERIAFRFSLDKGSIIRMDDIEVEETDKKSCYRPENVTASVVQQSNQVTVDWTPKSNESKWVVQYHQSQEINPQWRSERTETHPYTLTNLRANTDYNVRVLAICGIGDTSSASNVVPFTTKPVGIAESELSSIRVYSHQNRVYIVNNDNIPIQKVEITDIYGRVIYQGTVNDNPAVLNMNVATGAYIVRVQSRDAVGNYKVVVLN